jgi:sugar lactone lactonase YvrE
MGMTAARFSEYQAKLGESPVYDPGSKALYWVDILAKRIVRKDMETGSESFVASPDLVTSVQLAEKPGGLACTLSHAFCSVDFGTGAFAVLAEVEKEMAGNRLNDGKCDSSGRYWAGTMNPDLRSPTASLYVLDLDGKVKRRTGGLAVSNGLAWSKDDRRMYLIDTPVLKVFRFDYDPGTGEIQNKATCVDFRGQSGRPDGMTVDSEGMLWIAHARGGRISRWDPDRGTKLEECLLPVKATTSLTFGGEGLDRLYVTTSSELLGEADAGHVYVVDPGVKGLPPSRSRAGPPARRDQ